MLIDTHCHLDFPDFEPERDAVVARAVAAGVGAMVTISTRVKRFDAIRAIAERHDNVFCSVGTHPHNAAEELDITADDLVRLSEHPKVVALGELSLRQVTARCPGFGVSHPYRGRAPNPAPTGHPCAQRRR